MGGIEHMARSISAVLHERLPWQRKTQRENLALLVATMLSERSANLMSLAGALPRPSDRIDMRYQWIVRVLANPLRECQKSGSAALCVDHAASRTRRRSRSKPARP